MSCTQVIHEGPALTFFSKLTCTEKLEDMPCHERCFSVTSIACVDDMSRPVCKTLRLLWMSRSAPCDPFDRSSCFASTQICSTL